MSSSYNVPRDLSAAVVLPLNPQYLLRLSLLRLELFPLRLFLGEPGLCDLMLLIQLVRAYKETYHKA